ncbi:MAG TPA: MBL fold metallo-hydrolase [Burkholderiales bacterium]|nr:MBL fold metallo-hydrolase [Burkholderiales bacterium]
MKPLLALLLTSLCALHVSAACAFEGIRLTLLGGQTADKDANASTAMIEAGDELVLVGCGAGVGERLGRRGFAASDITAIFLTDLEPRHVAGCRELWESARQSGAPLTLGVWGPSGTRNLVQGLDTEFGMQADAQTAAFDITDNVIYHPQGITVTAFVAEPSGKTPVFGYRIDAYRRSVAVAGGTGFSENVARYAHHAHVLLQELSAKNRSTDETEASKATPEEAGKLFRAARPYLAVYTNVITDDASIEDVMLRTRRSYRGPVEVARDMMVIEVQNEVQVRSAPSRD